MEKINVAQLLKNCPKGIELDCIIWDSEAKVFLKRVLNDDFAYPIEVTVKYNNTECTKSFTKYGAFNDLSYCKCVIFPKGKTTWEGFQRPFKDGEIVATDLGSVFILKSCLEDQIHYHSYVGVNCCNEILEKQVPFAYKDVCHLATEEEKEKLFQSIKDNGYRWNPETKTLEMLNEPIFKAGDRIKLKGGDEFGIVTEVADCFYTIKNKNHTHCWPIKKQDDWELVPDKFDITTLKPFDKVLVREDDKHVWEIQFFERLNTILKDSFVCMGRERYHQCIPYEGNEHLLNTAKDCDEYFKTWK